MNLLLIDNKIVDIDIITSNLINTNYVLFNKESDTLDSLISKIPSGTYTNVGILQHNLFRCNYTFLDSFGSSVLKNVATLDPQLASWTNFLQLVNYLKTLGMTSLHFLQCNEDSVDWKYLKSKFLENQVSIEFSLNKTGLGGDWILESNNLNLVGLYFTEGILNYPHSLGVGTQNLLKMPAPLNWGDSGTSYMMVINKNKEVIAWGANVYWFIDNAITYGAFGTKTQAQVNGNSLYSVYNDNGNSYYTIANISDAISLSSGVYSSSIVKSNGNVIENGYGFLSGRDNLDTSNNIIYTSTQPTNQAAKIVSSSDTIFILDASGNVYCAGFLFSNNENGKESLGINATSVSTNGLQSITLPEKIKNIYCSTHISIFLGISGTIYTAGTENLGDDQFNRLIPYPNGSLGINATTTNYSSSVPTTLKNSNGNPITTKFKFVSTSYAHTYALDLNGTIWGWGSIYTSIVNDIGSSPYTLIGLSPTTILTDGTRFKEISTSHSHTVAIDLSNNFWSWGDNNYGQLGNGTTNTVFQSTPQNRGSITLYDSINNTTTTVKVHTIVCTGLKFTTIGYLNESGELLMASCGKNGLNKLRDPYDTVDVRVNFTKHLDSRAPILYNPYPYISSLSSTSGSVGDSITINGTGFFGLVPDVNKTLAKTSTTVTINYSNATITSITDTQIVIIVPTGTGTNKPLIVTNSDGDSDNKSFGSATFSYSSLSNVPTISNINKTYGYYNDTVIITGTNFLQNSIVRFGTAIANMTFNSITQITATIPNLKFGRQDITIETNNIISEPTQFVVSMYNTTIDSLTPNSGTKNSLVKITGTALNTVQTVTFNTTSALFTYNIDNSITATVPELEPGSYSVKVINPAVTITGPTFTYSSPPPTTTSTNICFVAGTPIKTDQGSIDIERINIDKHTINKNKIIAITKTKNETDDSLVFFEKNSIAKNYPKKDTIISRRHKILFKGTFKEAQEYINETTIYEIKYNDETLYNVLLDKHSTMKVNNLICETLHPENKVALFYKEKIKEGLSADKILIQFKSPIF